MAADPGRFRWQMGGSRTLLAQAEIVAVGCDQLPLAAHGRRVDGSSVSEGLPIPIRGRTRQTPLTMEAQQVHPPDGSRLRLRGSFDAGSRRLWLVTWSRAIPHYIVLGGIERATVEPSLPLLSEVLR